jgi:hypothetical protein
VSFLQRRRSQRPCSSLAQRTKPSCTCTTPTAVQPGSSWVTCRARQRCSPLIISFPLAQRKIAFAVSRHMNKSSSLCRLLPNFIHMSIPVAPVLQDAQKCTLLAPSWAKGWSRLGSCMLQQVCFCAPQSFLWPFPMYITSHHISSLRVTPQRTK